MIWCKAMNNSNISINKIKEEADLNKYANYYFLMHYWMKNIEEGKNLDNFFISRGYKKIAIYGTGALGMHLENQLSEQFKPIYTVDRGIIQYNGQSIPMKEAEDIVNKADVIVVTPVGDYEIIKTNINYKIDVISLEEIILSL